MAKSKKVNKVPDSRAEGWTVTVPKGQRIEREEDAIPPDVLRSINDGSRAEEWIRLGLTKGPRCTREQICAFGELLELPVHTVVWCEDPIVGGWLCTAILGGADISALDGRDLTREDVIKVIYDGQPKGSPPRYWSKSDQATTYAFFAQHDGYWLQYLDSLRADVDATEIDVYMPIVLGAAWSYFANGVAIMTPRAEPLLDPQGELHCTDGPVVWGLYALHGVMLPRDLEWIVREHETLDRAKIDSIANAEIRRVTIASYPDRYLVDPPIQRDSYGDLYTIPGEDAYRIVRVVDASSDRVYWLRCAPTCATAHEAVARSFGMTPQTYNPHTQT